MTRVCITGFIGAKANLLKRGCSTSRLSALGRACVKFNWTRWVATVDIESCCADEMDSLWRLKIMSFTQSGWEAFQRPFQLQPCWLLGVYQGQTGHTGWVLLFSFTLWRPDLIQCPWKNILTCSAPRWGNWRASYQHFSAKEAVYFWDVYSRK